MKRYRVGDIVPIRFVGADWPECRGVVTAVSDTTIHYRYTDDSPIFAGLRGMIRLPGWTRKPRRHD